MRHGLNLADREDHCWMRRGGRGQPSEEHRFEDTEPRARCSRLEQPLFDLGRQHAPHHVEGRMHVAELARGHLQERHGATRLEVHAEQHRSSGSIDDERLGVRAADNGAEPVVAQREDDLGGAGGKHALTRVTRAVRVVGPELLDMTRQRRLRNVRDAARRFLEGHHL